jgi:hypothetical protein
MLNPVSSLRPYDYVRVKEFDDIPSHLFFIYEVYEGVVTGYSVEGELQGEYGEPSIDMLDLSIREVKSPSLRQYLRDVTTRLSADVPFSRGDLEKEAIRRFLQKE